MPQRSVTLSWPRQHDVPVESGRLYPKSVQDAPVRLLFGDNLDILQHLGDELDGTVSLAYLDPPFLTGKAHLQVTRRRDARSGRLIRQETEAFDDHWSGIAEYLDALAPRLRRAFAMLAEHGSLIIHVDSKTSHYVKVLCDELFGIEHFASEIIWRYRRWPAKTPNFQRLHDVLLRYVRNPDCPPRFNQLYEPLAKSTVATWGKHKQRAVVDASGRRLRSSTTPAKSPGAPLGDVWEIGIVAPVAKERTGYPTQKPEALLERLICALTAPGDLVLDPYVGSGTSLVVAARLARRAIGIDQSPQARTVLKARLAERDVRYSEQRFERRQRTGMAS